MPAQNSHRIIHNQNNLREKLLEASSFADKATQFIRMCCYGINLAQKGRADMKSDWQLIGSWNHFRVSASKVSCSISIKYWPQF